ncbi:HAAS signaling domain-containing protein [Streptomyces sp. NPDC053431]|uniref:HAAS signaling domain-containing protein n=1 Tax=Streptomyces sp. NPDC053431 TaxID=3365703 RepID=UPI0037D71C33
MNAIDHPLVAAYLDAVARETAELPADRRAELLADLREHIEVSGTDDEQRIREVLAELGEPRTVAASALAEEPQAGGTPASPAPVRPGRARLTVGLLGVAGLLALLNPLAGGVALLAGLALLWTSPYWDNRHKLIGTATAAGVPVLLLLAAVLLAATRLGPTELLVVVAVSVAVPAFGAITLLRALRR